MVGVERTRTRIGVFIAEGWIAQAWAGRGVLVEVREGGLGLREACRVHAKEGNDGEAPKDESVEDDIPADNAPVDDVPATEECMTVSVAMVRVDVLPRV